MAYFTAVSFSSILYFALICSNSLALEDGSASHHTAFTPYYVPPGAKGYDSASPLVHYSGDWYETFSADYVGRSLSWTTCINASASFTFTGTGIEWFGSVGKKHGIADVYIDGELMQSVSTWGRYPWKQQRIFWNYGLSYGKHTLKIVNTQSKHIDVDAFVVTKGVDPHSTPSRRQDAERSSPLQSHTLRDSTSTPPQWSIVQEGSTGVTAMQIAIVSETHAMVMDKVEHNPLTVSGHPAWASLYNLDTHAVRPLSVHSNTFCAGGTFLANGSLINLGGNPVEEDCASPTDFGDPNESQVIRIFEPCDSGSGYECEMYENGALHTASPRWYATALRISDGSAMIIGGSQESTWINNAIVNNPTIEFFPSKSIHNSGGLPLYLPFLFDTLNSNLFPIAFLLPDGKVFMAANQDAMIYDWEANEERRLPSIPNGVRVTYPMSGTGVLLPLSPENNYVPEILICGGSTIDDEKTSCEISSQDPASAQCSRIVLTEDGIREGWIVEEMPHARTMSNAVLLPTGDVVLINGASTGISGFGDVMDPVGNSNADHPVLTPVVYDPISRQFLSDGMQTSVIPRMYQSVATLTPAGDIMVAGSNPNLDRSELKYGTEYRVEWVKPPYMTLTRPVWDANYPKNLGYGQVVEVQVTVQSESMDIKVALMDLGVVTHGVQATSRLVYLVSSLSEDRTILTITGPPNGGVYPPGPGYLYFVVAGVPSVGRKVMVGGT